MDPPAEISYSWLFKSFKSKINASETQYYLTKKAIRPFLFWYFAISKWQLKKREKWHPKKKYFLEQLKTLISVVPHTFFSTFDSQFLHLSSTPLKCPVCTLTCHPKRKIKTTKIAEKKSPKNKCVGEVQKILGMTVKKKIPQRGKEYKKSGVEILN